MPIASDTASETQAAPADGRDTQGRFVPGRSGNPAGRKRGSRNKATALREFLDDGEDGAMVRVVVERALQGDAVAARFLVDRLFPKSRGRPIELDLPDDGLDGGQALGHAEIYDAALRAMLKAEITPDEAGQVAKLLHDRMQRYGSAPATAGTTLTAPTRMPTEASPPAESPADSLQIVAGAGEPPPTRLDARLLASTSLKRAVAG